MQHVQSSEALNRGADERLDRRDVGGIELARAGMLAKFSGERRRLFAIDIGNDDLRAFCHQAAARSLADAGSTASDNGYLTGETVGVGALMRDGFG